MKILAAIAASGIAIGSGAVALNETVLVDTAFSSFNQAYAAAALGDIVTVPCGSYPGETIALANKGASDSIASRVVFRAEAPACVIVGSIEILAPHIELRGITVTGTIIARYRSDNVSQRAGNIHVVGVKAGKVQMNSVWNFRIAESDIGNRADSDGIDIYAYPVDDGHHAKNGIIEDNLIHDLTLSPGSTEHVDGIQFTAGENIDFRRNHVTRIHHQDILAKTDQGPIIGIRIESNQFDDVVQPGFSLKFNRSTQTRACSGHVVAYNTFLRTPTVETDNTKTCSGAMYANVWPSMSEFACSNWTDNAWVLSYNVSLSGAGCGQSSSSGPDLEGKGDPMRCPALDLNRSPRPLPSGSVCDAGAYESGAEPTPTEPEPTEPTPTEPPSAPDDRAVFCDEQVPSFQGNPYYAKWSAQNPGELGRWEPYRNAVCAGQSPVSPVMLTLYGKGLVAGGKMAAS